MPPHESIVHHPFAFQWGAFQLTGFGLAVLLAFGIADVIARKELERRGHDPEPIGDLVFAAIIGGLLGAKLYYVLIIARDIRELFTRAGFVFWGGLIGGILAVAFVIHRKGLRFTRISDVGASGGPTARRRRGRRTCRASSACTCRRARRRTR